MLWVSFVQPKKRIIETVKPTEMPWIYREIIVKTCGFIDKSL